MASLAKRALKNRDPNMDAMHAQQAQQQQLMGVNPSNMNMNMNMNVNNSYAQQQEVIYAFGEMEDVQGVVHLCLLPGKRLEHLGVKIQFVGRVDMSHAVYDGRSHYDFISLSKQLQ
eukprot:775163_1